MRNERERKKGQRRKLRSWNTELKLLLKNNTENNKMKKIRIRLPKKCQEENVQYSKK